MPLVVPVPHHTLGLTTIVKNNINLHDPPPPIKDTFIGKSGLKEASNPLVFMLIYQQYKTVLLHIILL